MAALKRPKTIRLYRVSIIGTGVNDTMIVQSHQVDPYPASTYHKFVLPNGSIILKNDFGVNTVVIVPVDLTPEEFDAEVQ